MAAGAESVAFEGMSEEEIAGWLETAAPQFEGLLSQVVPK